jgi:hypothetical protein
VYESRMFAETDANRYIQSNHIADHGFYDADAEERKKAQIKSILGVGKAHYASLIEQLIFMEETQI